MCLFIHKNISCIYSLEALHEEVLLMSTPTLPFHGELTKIAMFKLSQNTHLNLSLVVRKPAFCICENKDTDQLHGNHVADQRLCFHY